MQCDVKEVVGALMRVLGGDEISCGEVEDLAFEATGELQDALNEAYIKLLQFAFDHDERKTDPKYHAEMRAALERSLDEIIRLSESAPKIDRKSSHLFAVSVRN